MRTFALAGILFCSFVGSLPFVPAAAAQGHEDWSYNLGLYEVNIRQYTPEGTFDAFAEHLDRLEEMGVGILWFMPIHPIGQQNRLGSLGSYYSVRDYLAVNPEFGTLEDFRELVQAAHDRGMYVIMDWVANHTSWDAVLTQEHPEWYVTNSSGDFVPPPGTNWSDVIELDYDEQGLRAYMIDALLFWLEDVGVDGFRFDAVDYVPFDFWAEANAALTAARPDVFLLAEGNSPTYHGLGFHATFGWSLYGFEGGLLTDIVDGARVPAASAWDFEFDERQAFGTNAYRLYFTSNHDENSWSGTPQELFGDAAEAFAVLAATFRGMPLIYSGQEAGSPKRLAFFDKDLIPWRDHPNEELYTTLLRLKRENRALWNGRHGGRPVRVSGNNESNVLSFIREMDDDRVFAAFNLTARPQTVSYHGSTFTGDYVNPFTGELESLEPGETLELGPWEYVVLAETASGTEAEEEKVREGAGLGQNYPNPFSSETRIAYRLSTPGPVRLAVYDALGREVGVLARGVQPAGAGEIRFSAEGLPSGLYFYRLEAGNRQYARQMIVVN